MSKLPQSWWSMVRLTQRESTKHKIIWNSFILMQDLFFRSESRKRVKLTQNYPHFINEERLPWLTSPVLRFWRVTNIGRQCLWMKHSSKGVKKQGFKFWLNDLMRRMIGFMSYISWNQLKSSKMPWQKTRKKLRKLEWICPPWKWSLCKTDLKRGSSRV